MDAVNAPTASNIVKEAERNWDDYQSVKEYLQNKFDQPRELFVESLWSLLILQTALITKIRLYTSAWICIASALTGYTQDIGKSCK